MMEILHKSVWYNLIVASDGKVKIGAKNVNYWIVEVDPTLLPGYNIGEHRKFVEEAKRVAEQRLRMR